MSSRIKEQGHSKRAFHTSLAYMRIKVTWIDGQSCIKFFKLMLNGIINDKPRKNSFQVKRQGQKQIKVTFAAHLELFHNNIEHISLSQRGVRPFVLHFSMYIYHYLAIVGIFFFLRSSWQKHSRVLLALTNSKST